MSHSQANIDENIADAYEALSACLGVVENQAVVNLLSALLRLTNGAGALMVTRGQDGERNLQRMISKQAYEWVPDLDEALNAILGTLGSTDDIIVRNLEARMNLQCIAQNIGSGESQRTLLLVLVCAPVALAPFISLFQTVCAFELARISKDGESNRAINTARRAATLLEMLSNALQENDSAAVASCIVSDMETEIGADFSALAIEGSARKLTAMARVAEPDQRSAFSDSIADISELLWESDEDFISWSANQSHADAALNRSFQSIFRNLNAEYIEVFRSNAETISPRMALFFIWHTRPSPEQTRAWVLQAVNVLAPVFKQKRRTAERVRENLLKPSRQTAIVSVLILFALMFLPIPYKVTADAVVQPELRRFVAAPFDGILQETAVRPGDLVEQGSVVAAMDKTSLSWELEARSAELARAQKLRDRSLASGNRGAMNISELEIDKLNADIKLLSDRLKNLTIVSPIDGVILTGDLQRVEGAPVKQGDRLFEIASLKSVLFEINVPHDQISLVKAGDPVAVVVESVPGMEWQGEISRVHPRSSIAAQATVFKAEFSVDNPGAVLKPGMPSKASIAAGRKALGWVIFRKPYARLRYWLGW